ncbi:MAG: hypothetical protein ACLFVK_08040, partial [Dehalococcoidia bacterium]
FTVFLTLGCAVLLLVVSSSCVPVATNQDKLASAGGDNCESGVAGQQEDAVPTAYEDKGQSSTANSSIPEEFRPLVPESIDGHPVPKMVDGFPVVFVKTHERVPWIPPEKVTLVLYGGPDKVSLPEDMDKITVSSASLEDLPDHWTIGVFGGPGSSVEDYPSNLAELVEEHKEYREKYGPMRGGPSPSSGVQGTGPVGPQGPAGPPVPEQ